MYGQKTVKTPAAPLCVIEILFSKCDLLWPDQRVEAAAQARGRDRVQICVVLCDKVWNCVTI